MRTENNRAGGAIPRPFGFGIAALLCAGGVGLVASPARADIASVDEYPDSTMGRASFY